MRAGIDAQRLRKLTRHDGQLSVHRGGVSVVEQHPEARRDVAAPRLDTPLGFHLALEGALDLDDLHLGLKQPRGGPLEQSLEEPLDRGERAGHGRRV